MLKQNHPDDERLSALTSRDPDATADATLTTHVASCDRCGELVADLGALRASLADLPDLEPPRRLRLIPPVEAERKVDRLGGWARRFFGPALAAGAVLAVVGAVGTVSPSAYEGVGTELSGQPQPAALQEHAEESAAGERAPVSASAETYGTTAEDGGTAAVPGDTARTPLDSLVAERSSWPMVLFAGIALIIAALVLRWILVPRAG